MATVHALAYPIGRIFHVPHGLSNSLVLPHVLRFNLPEATEHYAVLAGIIVPDAQGSAKARADVFIGATQQIAMRTSIGRLPRLA